jgi:acylphosphatase
MKVAAKKNHVSGWVRNLKDGRVEAVLEGEDVNVSGVVEWCHAGPANARVEDIEIRNEKYKGEFAKFEVLY